MSDPEVISLDESSNHADDDIPDAKTCQERVEKFASITGTDEACAQFYLQDRKWDLETSVNAFFEETQASGGDQILDASGGVKILDDSGGVKILDDGNEELVITFDSNKAGGSGVGVTTEAPKAFRFVTWNVDGLDEKNLKKRTKAVAKILEVEKADIVFLQELIPTTYKYLEEHLPQFHFIVGEVGDYFTATLLRRTTVYYDGHTLYPFSNTCMGRNLLSVQAHIGAVKLNLLNSHLESTKDFAAQRKEQLRICFDKMKSSSVNVSTIFAGDLNARDSEVDATRIPNIFDLWESCGRRPECRWTWDTQRNTNKVMPGRFKPKLRFDRVYLKQSSPPVLSPKHFGLVGIQKVAGTESFPSDHWGIIVHFQVTG